MVCTLKLQGLSYGIVHVQALFDQPASLHGGSAFLLQRPQKRSDVSLSSLNVDNLRGQHITEETVSWYVSCLCLSVCLSSIHVHTTPDWLGIHVMTSSDAVDFDHSRMDVIKIVLQWQKDASVWRHGYTQMRVKTLGMHTRIETWLKHCRHCFDTICLHTRSHE